LSGHGSLVGLLCCSVYDMDLVFCEMRFITIVTKWPMDMRALLCRSEKICACRAATGKFGRLSSAVWVDCIMLPLGNRTGMPSFVGVLFRHGLLTRRKCPVHPKLA
jgi:hypothetical protein